MIGQSILAKDYVAWTAWWTWKGKKYAHVLINLNGGFFSSENQYAWDNGALVGAEIRNAITILHESKHWRDRINAGANHSNIWNKEIYDKCVKRNAILGTDPSGGPNPTSA